MGDVTNLDKQRRKHQRRRTAGRLAVLLVVFAVCFVAYQFRVQLTSDLVGVVLSDFIEKALDPKQFPIELDSVPKQLEIVGDRAAVITQNGLSVYNEAGGRPIMERLVAQSPIISTAGRWLMVYEQGGYDISVMLGATKLYEGSFNSVIYTADICEKGAVAVSCAASGRKSSISVMDKSYETIFEWISPEELVSTVSLSSDGSMLATGGVTVTGGELISEIKLFDLKLGEQTGSLTLRDEMVLKVKLLDNGQLVAVTDRSAVSAKADGTLSGRYEFDMRRLDAFEISDNGVCTIAVGDYLEDHSVTIVRLDSQMRQTDAVDVQHRVEQIMTCSDRVVALTGDQAAVYSEKLEFIRAVETTGALCAALGDDGKLYWASSTEIFLTQVK